MSLSSKIFRERISFKERIIPDLFLPKKIKNKKPKWWV